MVPPILPSQHMKMTSLKEQKLETIRFSYSLGGTHILCPETQNPIYIRPPSEVVVGIEEGGKRELLVYRGRENSRK